MSASLPTISAPAPLTLLDVWEQGQAREWVERALLLLAAASPDASLDALAALTLGQRDSCLLTLRAQLFGNALVCIAHCPECNTRAELELQLEALRAPLGDAETRIVFENENRALAFRLPNSSDLLALRAQNDSAFAREYLLARCALEDFPTDALGFPATDFIELQMAQADPQAQIDLELVCPECEHTWLAAFDIASYLWNELEQWALRVLREVHQLASAYGWSEREILETSPLRRQVYLDLTSAA